MHPHHPCTLAPMPPTLFSRIRNSPNLWGYFYSFKEVIFVWGVSTPLYAMDIFSILLSDFNSTPVLPANILGSFSCWTIFLWLFFLTSQNFHGFAHLVLKNEVSLIRSRARLTDIIFVLFCIFVCGCSGGGRGGGEGGGTFLSTLQKKGDWDFFLGKLKFQVLWDRW